MTATIAAEPLLDLKRRTTPAEFARVLRKRGDVFFSEPDRIWVVTSHELAGIVLKSPEFSADRSAYFASRMSGCPFHKIADFFGVVKRMMVTSDPPEHTARRGLAAFGAADEVLDAFAPEVERTVGALLGAVKGLRRFDFVSELALPLPTTVLADLFAVPPARRRDFYRWSNDMTQFFGGASENVEREAFHANEGASSLRAYFMELIAERRKRPGGDFISRLLAHQVELGCDDDELVSQSTMMLVAGTVTTTDQMSNNLFTLISEGVSARIEGAVEEATRLDPSVNFVFRAAKRDLTLGRSNLKQGELAFVSAHAANRDPRVFEAPDELRPGRSPNPHLSFGAGIHYCLGARLGRIQMKALLGRLFSDFPALRLDPSRSPVRKHQSLGFSGFESLSLEVS